MSRLRRGVLFDRFFLVTCRVLRRLQVLSAREFRCRARVISKRRCNSERALDRPRVVARRRAETHMTRTAESQNQGLCATASRGQ